MTPPLSWTLACALAPLALALGTLLIALVPLLPLLLVRRGVRRLAERVGHPHDVYADYDDPRNPYSHAARLHWAYPDRKPVIGRAVVAVNRHRRHLSPWGAR